MLRKRVLFVVVSSFMLFACTDDKASEKAALDEVIKMHDEVMGKDVFRMRNQMQMDTLLMPLPANDKYTSEQKDSINAMRLQLVAADEVMSTWMLRFDAELKGKTHQEKIKYYADQKKQIMQIDSQMTAAIAASDKYLKEIKK